MYKSALMFLVAAPLLVVGCGNGSDGGTAGGDGNDSGTSGSADAGDGDGDGNDGDGDGDGDDNGDGDGDGNDDGNDGDSGDGDSDDDDGGGDEPKWDTLAVPDSPACGGEGGGGDPDFSYIWVADSSAGQMWKINTKTLDKEGKYIVRPDSNGSPSRTSVSLSGHVAIANRYGGVTKVYATPESCEESNGMPGIQTSENGQVLPWGTEECVAWYTAMNYSSQRPVAWGLGTWNNKTCGYEDEVVWTSGTDGSTIDVVKLDGDDGAIDDMVNLGGSVSPSYFGLYGAAIDGDGNFWGSQLSQGKLVRVDVDDMSFETWNMAASGYGMTVDTQGYVWTCQTSAAARFDYETETWSVGAGGGLGCMEDGEGTLWLGGQSLVGVDIETQQQVASIPVGNYLRGVSIDFDGYVWGVSLSGFAYRCDPQDNSCDEITGLGNPYTYSDMTGFALSGAGNPSG